MDSKLTATEAETLAVMLNSASMHMASAMKRSYDPGYSPDPAADNHAWSFADPAVKSALDDMFAGFYEIAPEGIYI